MNIESITNSLKNSGIFHSEIELLDQKSIAGYEKKFKWIWFATQLNTFIVATDFGNQEVTVALIENHLKESFNYAKKNYTGWPRGFQSGLGVISILISSEISEEAKDYCRNMSSGKKWAAFTIPIAYNSKQNEIFKFQKNPIWGMVYYPHFRELINRLG